MNQNNPVNLGVDCKVTNCHYHTTDDKCTAEKIEVCDCADCTCSADTFCKTYREK
ncbi:MAG: DUF1540 domain-containing protein [Clostridiales bacterium]|nr:MAG: DUF1540 domain-containing protein [Clostridiales bacterium]